MYKDNLIIKKTKNGEGVFSNAIIPPRKPILYLTGKIFKSDTIKKIEDVIQIGVNLYLGLSGSLDDKINHSCNPSTFLSVIGDKAVLYSINEIKPYTEITYDYSVSCLDPKLTIPCSCGAINCRKQITDYNALPDQIKEKYLKLNILPVYVKHDIFSA